jgi:hypothetical protein
MIAGALGSPFCASLGAVGFDVRRVNRHRADAFGIRRDLAFCNASVFGIHQVPRTERVIAGAGCDCENG